MDTFVLSKIHSGLAELEAGILERGLSSGLKSSNTYPSTPKMIGRPLSVTLAAGHEFNPKPLKSLVAVADMSQAGGKEIPLASMVYHSVPDLKASRRSPKPLTMS